MSVQSFKLKLFKSCVSPLTSWDTEIALFKAMLWADFSFAAVASDICIVRRHQVTEQAEAPLYLHLILSVGKLLQHGKFK